MVPQLVSSRPFISMQSTLNISKLLDYFKKEELENLAKELQNYDNSLEVTAYLSDIFFRKCRERRKDYWIHYGLVEIYRLDSKLYLAKIVETPDGVTLTYNEVKILKIITNGFPDKNDILKHVYNYVKKRIEETSGSKIYYIDQIIKRIISRTEKE